MKTLLIAASFLISYNLFSQVISSQSVESAAKSQNASTVVRGVDISKSSLNEQGLINYTETLSDEDALEFLKSFVDGEIVFKESQENEIKYC